KRPSLSPLSGPAAQGGAEDRSVWGSGVRLRLPQRAGERTESTADVFVFQIFQMARSRHAISRFQGLIFRSTVTVALDTWISGIPILDSRALFIVHPAAILVPGAVEIGRSAHLPCRGLDSRTTPRRPQS